MKGSGQISRPAAQLLRNNGEEHPHKVGLLPKPSIMNWKVIICEHSIEEDIYIYSPLAHIDQGEPRGFKLWEYLYNQPVKMIVEVVES